MEEKTIESVLTELNESNPQIMLSMVITSDGLVLAYEGNVNDFEKVGALYIELQLVCKKIMSELSYGELEEVFVRSQSGCVMLMPISKTNLLACMSTPDVNFAKMQLITWKAANRLSKVV